MEKNNQVEEKLFGYIKSKTYRDSSKIDDTTLLFKEGIFDSMGFVSLLDFLEGEFGIQTSDEDLVEENFESVRAISAFIQKKRSISAA